MDSKNQDNSCSNCLTCETENQGLKLNIQF